jgi:hypothetical protein
MTYIFQVDRELGEEKVSGTIFGFLWPPGRTKERIQSELLRDPLYPRVAPKRLHAIRALSECFQFLLRLDLIAPRHPISGPIRRPGRKQLPRRLVAADDSHAGVGPIEDMVHQPAGRGS